LSASRLPLTPALSQREREPIRDNSDLEFGWIFQVGIFRESNSVSPLSLWECMYRTHGGQVFGDMVDTF